MSGIILLICISVDLLVWIYRCIEHSLHLGAGHFIEDVAPTSGCAVLKKVHEGLINACADDNGDFNTDQLNDKLTGYKNVEDEDDKEGEDGEPFTVSDIVGKALALVTQVN